MKRVRISILDVIKNRRTVRRFNERPISKKILRMLINTAKWAPCPNNLQPWYFVSTTKNSTFNKEVNSYIQKQASIKNIAVSIFLKDAIKILNSAPALIYVFNTGVLAEKYRILGKSYQRKANLFENQSISAAIENIILGAEELGVGTVWLGSPVFVNKGIEKILKTKFELIAIIGIGYYDKKPKRTHRLPLEEILRHI